MSIFDKVINNINNDREQKILQNLEENEINKDKESEKTDPDPDDVTDHLGELDESETGDNDIEQTIKLSEQPDEERQEGDNAKKDDEVKRNEEIDEKSSIQDSSISSEFSSEDVKAVQTEPSDRSQSSYEKDRHCEPVEGTYYDELDKLAKTASKQVLNEAISSIVESLMYPKIIKNLDDAFEDPHIKEALNSIIIKNIELYVKSKLEPILEELIEKKIAQYLEIHAEALLTDMVNKKVASITEKMIAGQIPKELNSTLSKYMNEHQVSPDYFKNYSAIYKDLSRLFKIADMMTLDSKTEDELNSILQGMLAKVIMERSKWNGRKEEDNESKE